MLADTSRGLSARSAGYPKPRRSMTPGPKFSSRTSAVFSSARKISLPRSAFKSSDRLRLLALNDT